MSAAEFDLKGRTALINGASRVIGEAIARKPADHGDQAILNIRKLDNVKRAFEDIMKTGGMAKALTCHTGESSRINQLFDSIQKQFGMLDIMVTGGGAIVNVSFINAVRRRSLSFF
jgi:NAD(P)-dependent dehydrogenase (short-subunit alcohol dehydrogenase family)